MTKIFLPSKYLFLIAAMFISVAITPIAFAQHEGHNMAGMSKPAGKSHPKAKVKRKSSRRHKKPIARSKRPATKHDMSTMTGRDMPGMAMSATPSASPKKMDPNMHMPGMAMPATPSASPEKMDPNMHMPGMPMPATSSASPKKMDPNMHMPGMPMPATSSASPEKMDPNMHMPGMPMPTAGASPAPHAADHKMNDMPGMKAEAMNLGPLMVMNGNDMAIRVGSSDTNVMSMGAMGSGTAWQPSSGPMHMIHRQSGDWLLMFHYNLLAAVNHQGGPRGVTKADSANWFMPMAYRKLGKGTLQLRGMFSLEPFTFPPGGSPLLFQTGETYKGQPLIDKQHPHDLFMELSAQYTLPVGEHATWFTYFGYPGEPALGPVAFMHRLSASENPSATLAHHLQDSTHISFGVLTTGFTYRWLKLEGSVFNGREPDENRYNFDAHTWNSRSARVSIMPNQNWVIQTSYGFLRSPEASELDTDIRRATASVQYNRALKRGNWASAFIWGRNHTSSPGETHNLNGYTLESTVNLLDKNYLYTRLELVDKNELLRASDRALLGIKDDHPSFRIGAYTFGGVRDIWTTDKASFAIGSDLTFYSKPAVLDQIYGAHPVSWKMFFRIRPGKMDMSAHGAHGTMDMTTRH